MLERFASIVVAASDSKVLIEHNALLMRD